MERSVEATQLLAALIIAEQNWKAFYEDNREIALAAKEYMQKGDRDSEILKHVGPY